MAKKTDYEAFKDTFSGLGDEIHCSDKDDMGNITIEICRNNQDVKDNNPFIVVMFDSDGKFKGEI